MFTILLYLTALILLIIVFNILYWRRLCYYVNCKGKYVFISGCDTGIGRKLAEYFDSIGCFVFAGCLNGKTARQNLPSSVTVIDLDVTKSDSVREAISRVRQYLSDRNADLWCLINNAGVCVCGEFDWLTNEQRQGMVDVNILGTMRLTKECLPLLRKSRGRVVVIGSVNGFISYPGLSVYCATKFALEGFCDALRVELSDQGIKVILVRPTDMARLTNIMARHKVEAAIMWQNMSEKDKEFYRDYFHRYQAAIEENYGLTSPSNFEQSPLIDDIKHAVLGLHPKCRYLCGNLFYRIVYFTLAFLPDRIRDYLLLRATKHIMK